MEMDKSYEWLTYFFVRRLLDFFLFNGISTFDGYLMPHFIMYMFLKWIDYR